MRKILHRKIDRAAVAHSLRELEKLFGKKQPTIKYKTQRKLGSGDTEKLKRGGV